MINCIELIITICRAHTFGELLKARQRPAVDVGELLFRSHILPGVKIVEISQNITGSVADFAVNFGKLLENLLGNADIRVIVGGSDPEPQDIGAVLIGDILRHHAVAQRLGHLLALAVNHPAMGADLPIRSLSSPGHCGQQG